MVLLLIMFYSAAFADLIGFKYLLEEEDELEEVSGGGFVFPNRSALKEGCKATVEGGSSCWGNDACRGINVIYVCDPAEDLTCPNCKTKSLIRIKSGGFRCHRCKFEGDRADCI